MPTFSPYAQLCRPFHLLLPFRPLSLSLPFFFFSFFPFPFFQIFLFSLFPAYTLNLPLCLLPFPSFPSSAFAPPPRLPAFLSSLPSLSFPPLPPPLPLPFFPYPQPYSLFPFKPIFFYILFPYLFLFFQPALLHKPSLPLNALSFFPPPLFLPPYPCVFLPFLPAFKPPFPPLCSLYLLFPNLHPIPPLFTSSFKLTPSPPLVPPSSAYVPICPPFRFRPTYAKLLKFLPTSPQNLSTFLLLCPFINFTPPYAPPSPLRPCLC